MNQSTHSEADARSPSSTNNLLIALHKLAERQDENFATEAFAHLLRHLQNFERQIAASLFDGLTAGRLKFAPEQCPLLKISTQETHTEGKDRVDIQISGAAAFLIVEVKVESEPGGDQLSRYRELLNKRPETSAHKALVLLSRHAIEPSEVEAVDSHVRWCQIARILSQRRDLAVRDDSRYLISQFLQFLKERRMASDRVSWELVRGVQSLRTLMDMLEDAVTAASVKENRARCAAEFTGRYFSVVNVECWAGVYYAEPQILYFEAKGLGDSAEKALHSGEVQKRKHHNGFKWATNVDLDTEEVHFFALSADSQQARVRTFIAECVSAVKEIGPAPQ